MRKSILVLVAAAAAVVPGGARVWAQQQPTPQSPLEAAAKQVDEKDVPQWLKEKKKGPVSFEQLVEEWTTPQPFPAKDVVIIDKKYAYPHKAVPYKMEIVKREGDTIWLKGLPPEDPGSILHRLWLRMQAHEMVLKAHEAATEAAQWVDFTVPSMSPVSVDTMSFVPAEQGPLPAKGRWQMNMDLADMNKDGRLDVVLPPARKGYPVPSIYFNDGDGTFTKQVPLTFASGVGYDYGGIAVGDYNGDGHPDLALAVHFKRQWVLYGDGAGKFVDAQLLPSPDARLTSRAVAAADFDGDGRTDLAFLAEVAYDVATTKNIDTPSVWVLLNRGGKKWQVVTEGLPAHVIGDRLVVADVDGDKRPDLLVGTTASGWTGIVLHNTTKGWKVMPSLGVLAGGYHFDVTPLEHGTTKQNFIAAVFEQFKMIEAENQGRTGLVLYSVTEGGIVNRGKVLAFDDQRDDPYFRLATGDVNGDGLADIVVGRKLGGLSVYLQQQDGRWFQERSPEFKVTATPYNLKVVDVNGDGRGDIIGMFADDDNTKQPGGIRVWLSKPGA